MSNNPEHAAEPDADMEITDEILMAYVDGDPELPQPVRRLISRRLPHEPDLVRRFLRFQFTSGPIRGVYDGAMDVPGPLLERIPAAQPRTGVATGRPRRRMAVWAMAAVGAVVMAGAVGVMLRPAQPQDLVTLDKRGVLATSALGRALETTLSGRAVPIAHDVSMVAAFTFEGEGGLWCRQFALRYGGDMQSTGLACRIGDGAWRLLLQTDAVHAPPAPKGQTLSGSARDPQDPEWLKFEAYREQVRQGDVLGREAEPAVVGRWPRKP